MATTESPPFMTAFNDLPLELLPDIIQGVVKPGSLALFCLVSKTFCKFTRPFLYHTVAIFPWHDKEKVIQRNYKSSYQACLMFERSQGSFVHYRLPQN